jgi:parallel beta-helix repeat protein
VIESATLRLYADSGAEDRILQAFRVDAPWAEGGVTWANQPATIGPAATTPSGDGYRLWDVVAQVQAMYDEGANHGFLVRDAENGGEGAEQVFYSREKGEEPPLLVLRFAPTDPASVPAPPLPPTAAVVRCGQVVTQSTLVANDLSECPGDGLVIGAARIVVDLGGYTIDGVGLGMGIRNDGFDGVVVRNGTVQDFDYGVHVQFGAKDNVFEGLTVQHNQITGIELAGAGKGNQIRSNMLTGNHDGITLLLGTSEAVVFGNTLSGNGGAGLLVLDSTGNRLALNRVSGGGDIGIALERSSGNTLSTNTVSDNSDGGIDLVEGSHGNRVEGNVILASGDAGLIVADSDRNEIISNTSQFMSDSGISLSNANDGIVRGNDVRFSPGGLQVDGSSRNLIEGNLASETLGIGIEIGGDSFSNQIVRNTANQNAATGIYVEGETTGDLGT